MFEVRKSSRDKNLRFDLIGCDLGEILIRVVQSIDNSSHVANSSLKVANGRLPKDRFHWAKNIFEYVWINFHFLLKLLVTTQQIVEKLNQEVFKVCFLSKK
jgi:hypothetical protein